MLEGIGLGDGVAVWCGGYGCGGHERVGRAGRVRGTGRGMDCGSAGVR